MEYIAKGTPYLMGEIPDGKGLGSIVLERISLVNRALRRHNNAGVLGRVRLKEMSEALTAEQVPRLFRGASHFNEISLPVPIPPEFYLILQEAFSEISKLHDEIKNSPSYLNP